MASKIDTTDKAEVKPCPAWARRLITAGLLWHAAAVWGGAWASHPASDLERAFDSAFDLYEQAIRQGFSYRYYSPEPPPTPVVTATLGFGDGRPEEIVRLPGRGTWPRMRYQRQLNLANWLMMDVEEARQFGGDPSKSRWANAFAAHLRRANPGCSTVTLRHQLHLVPPLGRVHEMLTTGRSAAVDLDADEFYTAPERIGEFR